MTTARRKPESETNDAPEIVTIPKGKKANVRTTISYEANIDKDTPTETNDNSENESKDSFREIPFRSSLRPFMPLPTRNAKANTLATFFDSLAEAGEDNYLVMITRLPDLPSEQFNRPQVLYPSNFPPMQCNASALPSFVQEIQKLNGLSGGRFDVRACMLSGEMIEDAELTNFVVPDPPRRMDSDNAPDNNNAMLAMFERINAENNLRFERMLETLKPQESELQTIAKQLLMKKLLEDDKPQSVNFEDMMMRMFTAPTMVEVYAEKMRDAMNGGKAADNAPTWMKLIESPFGQALGEKVGTITENLSQLAVVAATAKAQQANTMPNGEPIQPNPAPPVTLNENEEVDEMKALVEEIFDELENGEPFTDDNEFLQDLRENYPMEAQFVKMLCANEEFPALIQMLNQKAPELFNGFGTVDPQTGAQVLTERGQLLLARLQEFYAYMRGETIPPPAEPAPAPATEPKPPVKGKAKENPNDNK